MMGYPEYQTRGIRLPTGPRVNMGCLVDNKNRNSHPKDVASATLVLILFFALSVIFRAENLFDLPGFVAQ